jgi:chaperonin cofactor prefoldin
MQGVPLQEALFQNQAGFLPVKNEITDLTNQKYQLASKLSEMKAATEKLQAETDKLYYDMRAQRNAFSLPRAGQNPL